MKKKIAEIPILELSSDDGHHRDSEGSGEEWKELCKKVRESCEENGCFLLKYDRIGRNLREKMFVGMGELFDLPEETKSKYTSPKPYRSYLGNCPYVPYQESFGVDDATNLHSARSFTDLMWPQHPGNPSFCEILHEMSSEMLELTILILKMIYESFGVKSDDLSIEDSTSVFRMMKYMYKGRGGGVSGGVEEEEDKSSGGGGGGENVGLVAHTDKNALTILCQNDVQGLEVQSQDGEWAQVMVPQDAFIVIVGDTLKAWSNGRLSAMRHRVMINGEKERYSFGLFLMPKEEAMIEVPKELIDQDHPLMYRPFNYADYISYFVSKLSDDALEIYAGI